MKFIKYVLGFIFVAVLFFAIDSSARNVNPENPYNYVSENIVEADTIPPRYDDFVNDSIKNPFDLKDPGIIEQEVEYDPESGLYIITEKIGDDYFRAPTYMTFEEYLKWKDKQQRINYFNQLSGTGSGNRSKRGIVDPASYVDVKKDLIERLFGGKEITIKPQGSVHLTLGASRQIMENPRFDLRAQRTWNPIFDEGIQVNVEGGIGDKMKLNFNYNTKASFDFDNKIKLKYDSKDFNEDAILKSIEAGNVSLPLRGNLIQGGQNLFGIKTELQFGHLRLTAIASQQRSEQKNITIDKGAIKQEFSITPDRYDENRHFFISHYNRKSYEGALVDLPNVRTPFRITRIEVWVIPERNQTHDLRDICAIADLGEGIELSNPNPLYPTNTSPFYQDYNKDPNVILPDNNVSTFYSGYQGSEGLKNDDNARLKVNISTQLENKYKMKSGRDFEIFKGRKLSPSEYSYNDKLGFISLNRPLQPEDVLGVSYEYTYTYGDKADTLFRVGEFNEVSDTTGKLMYVKLLKSKAQNPSLPEWDLMMKNAYYIGGSNIDRESFKLDIYYEDVDGSYKRYIPHSSLADNMLLKIFNLDEINVLGDRQPDGIFDYIPGVTVIPGSGSIMFPVLEPFGKSLEEYIGAIDPTLVDSFTFNELYDTSIVVAQKDLEKNKFFLKGEYKSSQSSEISLGSWNIQGNPIVTSGGKTLVEGVDYDLDRGAGKIRIINPSILQSGRPVNVRFEDNSLFNLTQKNMLGLRADYEISKNFNVGATYMHLFERPYTQKVSYGDDPINNRMFGVDMDYSTEADWLTRAIDKLPLISTKAKSQIHFNTEVAALKPGHSSAINGSDEESKGGQIILDDFEGASVKLYLNTENDWVLASTPKYPELKFPDGSDTTLAYGANRALLNWYVAEGGSRSSRDKSDPYSRLILRQELFQTQIPAGSLPDLRTFDINFYPSERGPYNFDIPGGYPGVSKGISWDSDDGMIKLNDPESRWAGMMRYMRFSDFEKLNMEYVEFWMLNPFIETDERKHDLDEMGEIVFNLGNVSEDILKDGLQFYENSIPQDGSYVPKTKTIWGDVPNDTPLDDAFPNNQDQIDSMDLGLDGLDDRDESVRYAKWIQDVKNAFGPQVSIGDDVANDNWVYFGSDELSDKSLLEKYKKYNNTQGNFPNRNNGERRGKLRPDKEEINDNKSLDINESFYEYRIKLPIMNGVSGMEIDTTDNLVKRYITDVKTVKPAKGDEELWYRFRIPIDPDKKFAKNGIDGLRSIQFMRMYFTGFKNPKTFRLAEFGLVRNQWRKNIYCKGENVPPSLNVDVVGFEENQSKTPFGYRTPIGVKRERLLTNYENIVQDEKSLSLKFSGLRDTCAVSVYKFTNFDARLFKRIQLYTHAESQNISDDTDLRLYFKVGKDFQDNYYEYEIPLTFSTLEGGNTDENIWPDSNDLDIELRDFINIKLERNKNSIPLSSIYIKQDTDNPKNPGALIKVKGNPSLGYIKQMEIGVRNYGNTSIEGEVWVNELVLGGLEEKGGVAATANLDIGLADLGAFNASFNYLSVGFGALDEKLAERSLEEVMDYDLSTSIQLGKFFPKTWGVNLPLFMQYGQTIRKPKYDPYDLDLTVDEKVASAATPEQKQDFKDRALDVVTVKSLNVANFGINTGSTKYPWSPSNLKLGYYYTNKNYKNPIVENEDETDQKVTLDYTYSLGNKYIKPFKKVKWIKAKVIKDIHFNPLPNSFSFNTQLRKFDNQRTLRESQGEPRFTFEDKRFNWDRNYSLRWNFTKDLKLNFTARQNAIVDEYKKYGATSFYVDENFNGDPNYLVQKTEKERRDYMWQNLKDFGRPKSYSHAVDVSYKLPLKNIPFLKWITVNANYKSTYDWMGVSPSMKETLGHTIANTQRTSLDAKFDFQKLYKSIKYLNNIDKGFSGKKESKKRRSRKGDKKSKKKKKNREPSAIEKIVLRPLLMFRDVKFKFNLDRGTTVPGYRLSPELLGTSNDFNSPGFDFVVGAQPDFDGDWLINGANNNWYVTDSLFNSLYLQDSRINLSAKVKLEPVNHLKIDIEFKKAFTLDRSRQFNALDKEFYHKMDRGSFEVTYLAFNTLFTSDYETLFDKFSDSRSKISYKVAVLNGFSNPESHEDYPNYAKGYGPQSQEVLIPAFLHAYTGADINDSKTYDIYNTIKSNTYIPRPNWRIEYDINRYSFFKDIFSSFKISNGYKSILRVSSFQTDLNWEEGQFRVDDNEHNYYSEYIMPSMILEERFEPLIGIDIKTKSDFSIRFDYKKSRSLLLSQKSLEQKCSEEIVLNVGYLVKNVYIPFLMKKPKKNKRKKRGGDNDLPKPKRKSTSNNLRDLRISFDMSLRDNEVKEYLFDKGRNGEPTHGNYRISIAPTLEYNITDNFSLQMDFSYDKTKPYVRNSNPSTNYRGTITAKYSLK